MRALHLAQPNQTLSVLCLGAHSDDIEIGAGGTILHWIESGIRLEVRWCVLSAIGPRAEEARASAEAFLAGAASSRIELGRFKDGFFPYQGHEIKAWLEILKDDVDPDVILTHAQADAHQDHREVCQLTWNLFRDHLILEYEIPKYDGDLGSPNVFFHLSEDIARRKVELLLDAFPSQREKRWFTEDLFLGLMRVRGMESNSPSGYAEGFYARKVSF